MKAILWAYFVIRLDFSVYFIIENIGSRFTDPKEKSILILWMTENFYNKPHLFFALSYG